jgi:hypothetical protein
MRKKIVVGTIALIAIVAALASAHRHIPAIILSDDELVNAYLDRPISHAITVDPDEYLMETWHKEVKTPGKRRYVEKWKTHVSSTPQVNVVYINYDNIQQRILITMDESLEPRNLCVEEGLMEEK